MVVKVDTDLEKLPNPENRFTLGSIIGTGISSIVYEAIDNENGGMKVAIKILKLVPDYIKDIEEEYNILKNTPEHINLPQFYGAYYKSDEVWFVMELCEGGAVIDLIKALIQHNRHISEEHIAYILKETVEGLCHLHKNHIIHRDVKSSNILFTSDGTIKIIDFGLSRKLQSTLDKRFTSIGSPCWMAPEMIVNNQDEDESISYDNKIDVWALGITAIEIADGKAPFEGMHPSRAIFQIVRNPPPTFLIPSQWSQLYTDFVAECLTKTPEERPIIFEFQEHPFLTSLPEKYLHLGKELVQMKQAVTGGTSSPVQDLEIQLRNGGLQKKSTEPTEPLIIDDLAALDNITEDTIMTTLQERYKKGIYYTYLGDILLFVNPNKELKIFGDKYHQRYSWRSRSDNMAHVYSIADGAFQDMIHHSEPQHIILSGETNSGKTTNYIHLLDHLLYLGGNGIKVGDKIRAALKVIHGFCNAATPHNGNSTRHILNTQVTFTKTGKISGAIFWVHLLEKLRVSGNKTPLHGNFHMLYYFYDGAKLDKVLSDYQLEDDHNYRYLVRRDDGNNSNSLNSVQNNANIFKEIISILGGKLEFEGKLIETIKKTLAAVLLIGEIKFTSTTDIENMDVVSKIATLLSVEEKKLSWSLRNYCVVQKGAAVQKTHTNIEAEEAKHVFARGLYGRLVDFVVNMINLQLSLSRVMMGDEHYVSIVDIPGFEMFEQNGLETLFVNTINEEMQYFYSQKIFSLELKELEEEGVVLPSVQYYDNKPTIDELIGGPDGLLYVIDEASRTRSGYSFIIETLANSRRGTRVRKATSVNFSVGHYARKVEYNSKEMPTKNHDFLPPELIEILSTSANSIVKQMFTNSFTRGGNLTISAEQNIAGIFSGKRKKWGTALISGDQKSRRFINTEAYGEYSQTRRMRTLSQVFRASCLELLKQINENEDASNTHFIRCIKASPNGLVGFEHDIVSVQLRSLGVIDTAKNRQKGYSYRVSFKDFIERYKYLAFDFDEEVELTRENCRLLLIRLKLEGWIIGKNKVFLRYYDKEYLSRLYETHVRKITKIQAMMRTFLTKRKVIPRMQSQQSIAKKKQSKKKSMVNKKTVQSPKSSIDKRRSIKEDHQSSMNEEMAASIIQREYRGYKARKECDTLFNPDENNLAKIYSKKWRAKSLFQVLLAYRAHRFQEMTNFSQQIHLYNQHVVGWLLANIQQEFVALDAIKDNITLDEFIGYPKPITFRLPFALNHHSLYDSGYMYNPFAPKGTLFGESENWDSPIKYLKNPRSREHCITRHVLTISDRGIQTENGDEQILGPTNESDFKFQERIVGRWKLTKNKTDKTNVSKKTFRIWLKKLYSNRRDRHAETEEPKPTTTVTTMTSSNSNSNNGDGRGKPMANGEKKHEVQLDKQLSSKSDITDLSEDEGDETTTIIKLNTSEDQIFNKKTVTSGSKKVRLKEKSKLTAIHEENGITDHHQRRHHKQRNKTEENANTITTTDTKCYQNNRPKENQTSHMNGQQVSPTYESIPKSILKQNKKIIDDEYEKKGNNGIDKSKNDALAEMKIKGRSNVDISQHDNNENEPPFNFQALLRKTSLKEELLNGECATRFKSSNYGVNSIEPEENDENSGEYNKSIFMRRKSSLITAFNNSHYIISELSPGVVIEGQICDV